MGGSIGGSTRPVTADDLMRFEDLQALQRQSRVPVLYRREDPDAHVFVALFDGTGQDVAIPAQRPTNIGQMKRDLDEVMAGPDGERIAGRYIRGIGTDGGWFAKTKDQAIPNTWDDRLEEMYRALASQAARWTADNPNARIGMVLPGYSRGAVLDAGFARMVDTYGIADPDQLSFGRDAQGNVTIVSPHPPLVPPGQTPMVFGLYDPVATNMPDGFDARLPPGAMAGLATIAADEARRGYPHQTIIATGVTRDGRFVSGEAPGGHADAGGGNPAPGLQAMHYNLIADTLNATSDTPLFKLRELPRQLDDYRLTQAGGITAGYGLGMDRDGQRNLRDELANCKVVDPCREAEPMNAELAARLQWRNVQPTWRVPKIEELERAPERVQIDRGAEPVRPGAATPSPVVASPSAAPQRQDTPQARADDALDPTDRQLLDRIRQSIGRLDASHGRTSDDASERAAWALLPHAKARGMTDPQHAVVSIAGPNTTAGQHLFLVQGALDDPAKLRVHVNTVEAMQTPVEQSLAKVQAIASPQAFEAQRFQQQDREQAHAVRMQA